MKTNRRLTYLWDLSRGQRGRILLSCLTGILGSIFGPWLCRLLRLTWPAAQGAAFGTSAHVIGTAKAAEFSQTCEAVSSLSLVFAGILTAVLCPLLL